MVNVMLYELFLNKKKILGGPSKTSRDRPGKARGMRTPRLRELLGSKFKSNNNQALFKKW